MEFSNKLTNNHSVYIVVFKKIEDKTILDQLAPGITVISLSKRNKLIYIIKLLWHIIRINPQVIQAHLTPSLYPMVFLSLLLPWKKRFFTLHYEKFELKNKKLEKLYSKIIPLLQIHFIVLTKESAKHLNLFFNQKNRIHIVPNGIKEVRRTVLYPKVQKEVDRLKFDKNTQVFISVGRIAEVKNFPLLIEAFKLAYAKNENAILIIVGSATDESKNLQDELIQTKSINTFFLGMKKNVVDYLFASDFYACSSYSEGIPLSLLEALSCRLPIISTSYTNVSMILEHNTNGFIIDTFDPEKYYHGINRLVNLRKKDYRNFATHSYNIFSERFRISKVSKQYEELIGN